MLVVEKPRENPRKKLKENLEKNLEKNFAMDRKSLQTIVEDSFRADEKSWNDEISR